MKNEKLEKKFSFAWPLAENVIILELKKREYYYSPIYSKLLLLCFVYKRNYCVKIDFVLCFRMMCMWEDFNDKNLRCD